MRILITGGTGFLGKPLAGRLAQDGHEVIVLTRNAERAQPAQPPGVKAVKWDGRTSMGWAYLADGAGAVINLAGESIAGGRWSSTRKKQILVSRLEAGAAVVEAIEKARRKPEVLIQSSATGYYGNRGDELITESEPAGGDNFESQVCLEWERSTQTVESMGVRRPIVRTAVVIERDGGALPRMALPYQLFGGGPIGSGQQGMSWIHLNDWVDALRFLLVDSRAQGPINVTAPQPVSMNEFGQALGRALGRPHWLPAPSFAFRILLGEMADILLHGRKAVPARLEEWGFKFRYPTVDKALRAIYGK